MRFIVNVGGQYRLWKGCLLFDSNIIYFPKRHENKNSVSSQKYWVFGLCPSSGFFLNNNEKHNVSETGSVSVLR
jgi:hypothetical protein